MEREIIMTGIGGQGVQLATKVLAHALNMEEKPVTHFAIFGGSMRGGDIEAIVITGDREIAAPPMINQAWATIAMHQSCIDTMEKKVKPGGLVFANSSVITKHISRKDATQIDVPASELAEKTGHVMTLSMVMLGAFVESTHICKVQSVIDAMKELTPSYRKQHIETNTQAINAGAEYARTKLGKAGKQTLAWVTA